MPDEISVPVLRNDESTLEERMSGNAYNDILPARYLKKNEDGEIIEKQEELFKRVARNIAVAEAVHGDIITEEQAPDTNFHDVSRVRDVQEWSDKFQHHMEHLKFVPNTPTLINAGTDMQQLSACFVDSPEDDLQDIGDTETEASLIFQSGGGVGYDFGKLRPYGDIVGSTGGIASGPITFMQRYDQNCETIAQGGVRRGAQMGTMQVTHPDIIHFIHAKNKDVSLAHQLRLNDPDDPTYTDFGEAIEEARSIIDDEGRVPDYLRNAVEGHLSNFNISVTITDDFMEALEKGEEYTLINPRTGEPHIATEETKQMYEWFDLGDEVTVGEELTLPAEKIWTRIVEGAYENGEPGVIYSDTVNEEHSYDIEEYPEYEQTTTNPCAEQPLMEYEACNLGHINLSTIVDEDVTPWVEYSGVRDFHSGQIEGFLEQAIDWDEFDERIEVGTRFLDNVVTMSDFPIPEIEETVRKNRKIGLGVMGLAQLYIQLGVEYGSDVGNEIARQLMTHINQRSKSFSNRLAKERGKFENWKDSKYANPTEYRGWFEKHVGENPDKYESGYPIRNHNTTTIAPTGTTSRIANTTGGCEPIYNVAFYKNVTDDIQGDDMLVVFDSLFIKTLEENNINPEEVKDYAKELMSNNEFDGVDDLVPKIPQELADLFVTTSDLDSKEHAGVLCALQDGVDSSISKTLNAPFEATLDDAKETFEYVYENGGKSVTFYRDGTRTKQVNTTRKDNQDVDDKEEVEGSDVVVTPRERPKNVNGETHRIDTPYGNLYVTINEDEHGPVEMFATVGKSGGQMESFTEALARQVSLSLRAGIHIDEVIDQLENIRSPEVSWDNGDTVYSIPDAMALALKRYREDYTSENDMSEQDMNHTTVVPENFEADEEKTGEECPDCGQMMIYKEGCKECPNPSCGYSKC